jgi:tetratricopeptide (TPR) repeat protein
MRASPFVLCCWPGLPRLWVHGEVSAVALALGFGAVLNLLLVSNVLWPELIPASGRTLGWFLLAAWWLFSAIRAFCSLERLNTPTIADSRGLFIQAQGEYLKGHWFEAESLLQQLLRSTRRDLDAHLMLATLCRRTKRYDEAQARLDLMDQFDGAEKWRWEIEVERRLLQQQAEKERDQVDLLSSVESRAG